MTHKEIIEEANRRYVGCYANPSDASKHEGFVKGAQWANEQIIEHACKWLAENADKYSRSSLTDIERYLWVDAHIIEDFRKAMEE